MTHVRAFDGSGELECEATKEVDARVHLVEDCTSVVRRSLLRISGMLYSAEFILPQGWTRLNNAFQGS